MIRALFRLFRRGAEIVKLVEAPPPRTLRMVSAGFSWKKLPDGEWIPACDFCGGNCGQCGTSLGMDVRNQPSMDTMIKKL